MKYNNWKVATCLILISIFFSYLMVYFFIDWDDFNNLKVIEYSDKKLVSDNYEVDILVNERFHDHNTSLRTKKIKYIVIHYTGTTSGAKKIVKNYNNLSSIDASADFFIDQHGTIIQYNPDIDERYSWAVAGNKRNNMGGSLHNIVTNENSVSIEMCVWNYGELEANSKDWILTDYTLNSTIRVVKYLMDKYDIPLKNVVRHYDVSGKLCPGIVGWNEDSGSNDNWKLFLSKLE